MSTARNLAITSWVREAGDSPLTVAVPGLKLTGWWPRSPPPLPVFEDLRVIWPQGVTFEFELDILEDPDGLKHQFCAYVRIHRYPEQWIDILRDSLKFFVDALPSRH